MARWDATLWPADPGDIADRLTEISDRVRVNLHAPDDDEWVEHAINAAIGYVIAWTGRAELGLPSDDLTTFGLVGFAERIYLDQYGPTGAQTAVGDLSFEPMYTPEHLYRHWRHYFDHLTIGWGIA